MNRHARTRIARTFTLTVATVLGTSLYSPAQAADFEFDGHGAHDPGPRPNPAATIPKPVPGLNKNETALFYESLLMFTVFMRFVDAPQPAEMNASALRGRELFRGAS